MGGVGMKEQQVDVMSPAIWKVVPKKVMGVTIGIQSKAILGRENFVKSGSDDVFVRKAKEI